jgi:hypothetical protein
MLAKSAKIESPDPAAVEEELQRLIESPGLQHAESLCHLLRYLVGHALAKPQEHLKEYQIAVDVFGRSESFDSRLDSSVRVQTSRLRNKLVEYYATSGVNDSVMIEIPKGTYSALFHWRPPDTAPVSGATAWIPTPQVEPQGPNLAGYWLRPLPAILAALAIGLLLGWLIRQPVRNATKTAPDQAELRTFWNSVLKSPNPPLLIFSNAEFSGRPETGLHYFNSQADSRDHINDLYTGVGEALAIGELSGLFSALGRDLVVKRSGLLSWDDTKYRDLIFAGSPTENLSLRELPVSQEFVFRSMQAGDPRPGDLAIINEHPHPGEPALFLASAALPLAEDYAVVTLQPGLQRGQTVLLLAGTTTLGTQAAAEFVCQNDSLAVIRKRLGISSGSLYTPFSAVLHVQVAKGVPMATEVAAIHPLGR